MTIFQECGHCDTVFNSEAVGSPYKCERCGGLNELDEDTGLFYPEYPPSKPQKKMTAKKPSDKTLDAIRQANDDTAYRQYRQLELFP